MKPHDQRLIFALMSLPPDRGVDADAMPSYDFGGGCDMDTRVAKLEAFAESSDRRLSLIEQDIRQISSKMDKHFIIFASTVAVLFLVLAGAMWQGYTKLEEKISASESRSIASFDKVEAKLDTLLDRLPKK